MVAGKCRSLAKRTAEVDRRSIESALLWRQFAGPAGARSICVDPRPVGIIRRTCGSAEESGRERQLATRSADQAPIN